METKQHKLTSEMRVVFTGTGIGLLPAFYLWAGIRLLFNWELSFWLYWAACLGLMVLYLLVAKLLTDSS